jgi:lipopolysaccharide transport system ATP-binding protein
MVQILMLEFQKKCLGKMGDVSKGEGRTILFVSHNMGAIKNLCSSSIFLNNGRVEFIGDVNAGISKYYSSNIDYLENKEVGIFDFKNHINKKNAEYGILKAELYCDNILTKKIISGSKVKIKLYYNAYRDFFEPEIGIVIKDYENNNYIGLNNKHLGIDFNIKEGKGSVEIIIDNFPIYGNSEFFINLYLLYFHYSLFLLSFNHFISTIFITFINRINILIFIFFKRFIYINPIYTS